MPSGTFLLFKGKGWDRGSVVYRRFLAHLYDMGKANRPKGVSGPQMVSQMLDTLGIGQEVTSIRWSPSKVFELPPSRDLLSGNSSIL